MQRAIKKSESTEGTPVSKVPITNPTKGTKISTSLKNKSAFEKFHPANKDEYSSTQHASKASVSGAGTGTGTLSKLGQYQKTATQQKRLTNSGHKRPEG